MFLDGFETADFSLWDDDDKLELVTDPVYQDVYAAHSIATGADYGYLYKSIADCSKVYIRMFILLKKLDSYQSDNIFQLSKDRSDYHMAIYLYGPGGPPPEFRFVVWDYYEPDPWKEGTTILEEDTWYKVELEYEKGLNKRKRLWVNDNLDIDFTEDGSTELINAIEHYPSRSDLCDQILDDFVVCAQ